MRLQRKKKTRTQTQAEGAFIQPKLKVGQPGDKYEVEADNVADKVVNKTSTNSEGAIQKKGASEEEVQQKPLASSITPLVQTSMFKDRKEGTVQKQEEEEPIQAMEEEEQVQKQEEEEPVQTMEKEEPVQKQEEEEPVQTLEEEEPVQKQEEEEPVQAKCDDCEKEESVQKKGEEEEVQTRSNSNESTSSKVEKSSIESRLKSSKGKGSSISGDTKHEMESGFGTDFSNVNIHTDSNAIQMSKELGAQAFTHGNDVYFNKGKYNPNSKSGKHLLAHELTHTIQQKGNVIRKQDADTCDRSVISAARQTAFFRVQNVKHKLSGLHPTLGAQRQREMMRLARKLVSPRVRSLSAVQLLIDTMMNVLTSDNSIVCGPEIDNCSVWNGYVEGNSAPIHLCSSFFGLSEEGQVRTLIHEAAHAAGIGNPEAELYIPIFDCETGADDFTSADAWAHFVNCASGQTPDQPDQ